MKNFLFCVLVVFFFASCNQNQRTELSASNDNGSIFHFTSGTQISTTYKTTRQALRDYDSPIGLYTGMFEASEFDDTKSYMYANKITISIDSLKDGSVWGHSIVAGNSRPFTGTVTKGDPELFITAKEPGDDRYDGEFTFVIKGGYITIEGAWAANDKNLPVTKRTYILERREFFYNAELMLPEGVQWDALYGTFNEDTYEGERLTADVFKYNASTTRLKSKDISNMYMADLEVMRNAIYARHGYSFKNRRMRYIFDNYVNWYMPISTNITNELTQLEKDNIELLKRYEAHAEKYYDSFGR